MNTSEKFDLWCIVELFGHAKIAGRCTEQNIAGTNMLRVDVPETDSIPAFTRFFGSGAIYAINPVDEQTARFMADKLQVKPIDSWNVSEIIKKHNEKLLINASDTKQTGKIMNRGKNIHIKPIDNLMQYVHDRMIRQQAGWIGGKYYVNGKYYTEQEFDQLYPAVLKYKVIQMDGTQLSNN